jgi:tetratricopeptide (TPR) repeat protein
MSAECDHLLLQALQARRENRLDDAERGLVEAVALCRKAGTRIELAKALTSLGQIERDLRRLDTARQHYEEAAILYRAEGEALRLAHTVRHVGDILREQGRPELAGPCYREALALYRGHGQTPPLDLANAIRGLALLKDEGGEVDEARALWEEAKDLYRSVNVEPGVAECSRRIERLASG